jgi:type IV pilus assembly protein PilX
MLIHRTIARARSNLARRQNGVVMLVALIVLVIMTMAGLALMRSMDTTNLIAGNMAFKQAATQAADAGLEAANAWLEANLGTLLQNDFMQAGYLAGSLQNDGTTAVDAVGASSTLSGDAFWNKATANPNFNVCYLPLPAGAVGACTPASNRFLTAADQPLPEGYKIGFMIQRMCSGSGVPAVAGCSIVTGTTTVSGCAAKPPSPACLAATISTYYRITVRVDGPRNTVSYVQAVVYK